MNASTIALSSSAPGLPASKSRAGLGKAGIAVTLIDRQNHHLFQPLLYQVATAALSPADIAEPVRKVLRGLDSVEVMLGEVVKIDTQAKSVTLADGGALAYDWLIVATGATHGYFGHDEWAAFAPGLKTIEDARTIRSRLLMAFEKAEMSRDPVEQKRLMTIAVIGGGPTGVELAGSIAELARYTLSRDFHRIRAETATVLLLEAGPRLLTAFPDDLASYAERKLKTLGVTVRTNCPGRERPKQAASSRRARRSASDSRSGGGRDRIRPRQAARRADGPRGPRDGRARSVRAGARSCVRAGRSRAGARRERKAVAGTGRRSPSRKASISATRWRGK